VCDNGGLKWILFYDYAMNSNVGSFKFNKGAVTWTVPAFGICEPRSHWVTVDEPKL
ncbi:hypothetical protein K0M31_012141, partial [Melipona bicolor]